MLFVCHVILHKIFYFSDLKERFDTIRFYISEKKNAHIEETSLSSFYTFSSSLHHSRQVEKEGEKERRRCFFTRDVRKTHSNAIQLFIIRIKQFLFLLITIYLHDPHSTQYQSSRKVTLEKIATLFESSFYLHSTRNLKIKVSRI